MHTPVRCEIQFGSNFQLFKVAVDDGHRPVPISILELHFVFGSFEDKKVSNKTKLG
jgi:hypothetical protein